MKRMILVAAFVLGWFAASAVFADTVIIRTKDNRTPFAALKAKREIRNAAAAAAQADYWTTRAAATAAIVEKTAELKAAAGTKKTIEVKIEK